MEMEMEFLRKLPTPQELKEQFPVSTEVVAAKAKRDEEIRNIFEGKDDRLILVIGPCSADNEDAVCDYANRLAKVQENYRQRINQYIKCDFLILDEWLLIGINNAEQQDILEILEKRYRIHSTVFCSQFDVAGWHSKLGGGALADAIMDRIISKSQTIKIFGDKSMRSR